MEKINSPGKQFAKAICELAQDVGQFLADFNEEVDRQIEEREKPKEPKTPKSKFMEEWDEFRGEDRVLVSFADAINTLSELIDKYKADKEGG